mmetsp:Transcript_31925/g.98188  ORF Transcript_31925/g.98188 Transcript_31925/m.98188 type:complete len:311 (+) Transcript_31925:146-1078(+)
MLGYMYVLHVAKRPMLEILNRHTLPTVYGFLRTAVALAGAGMVLLNYGSYPDSSSMVRIFVLFMPVCFWMTALFLLAVLFEVAGGKQFSLSPLTYPMDPGQINETVVIVGNGPSVFQHKLGHAIDQFDVVVRLNQYSLDPEHTPFTGSKTTHVWTDPNLYPLLSSQEVTPEKIVLGLWNTGGAVARLMYLLGGGSKWELLIGTRFWRVRKAWKLLSHKGPFAPKLEHFAQSLDLAGLPRFPPNSTIGFAAILFYLQRHEHVHFYGLDYAEEQSMHYCDGDQTASAFLHARSEKALLQEFIRRKKVTRLTQ